MSDSDGFNPYHRWLGIPLKDQPPNHYRLLGLELFEEDPDVINSSADRQMLHVRTFQTGRRREVSQRLLNELSTAKVCLLNADSKATYDAQLRGSLQAEAATKRALPANESPSLQPVSVQPRKSTTTARRRAQTGPPLALILGGLAGTAVVIALLAFAIRMSTSTPASLAANESSSSPQGPASASGDKTSKGGESAKPTLVDSPRSDGKKSRSRPARNKPREPKPRKPRGGKNGSAKPAVTKQDDNPKPAARPPKSNGPGPNTNVTEEPLQSARPADLGPGPYSLVFSGRHYVELKETQHLASWNQIFTAEMWVRWDRDGRTQQLMGTLARPPALRAYDGWSLAVQSNGDKHKVFPTVNLGGAIHGFSPPSAQWLHVAIVHDESGRGETYIDGKRVASGSVNYTDKELCNLCVGVPMYTDKKAKFFGEIRAFRLSSVARYTEPFTPPAEKQFAADGHTLALLDFSTAHDHTIKDASGNGRDGGIVGARWRSLAADE